MPLCWYQNAVRIHGSFRFLAKLGVTVQRDVFCIRLLNACSSYGEYFIQFLLRESLLQVGKVFLDMLGCNEY